MIIVELTGGMGNQMFQYAYARALSLEYNEPIVINTHCILPIVSRILFPKMTKESYRLDTLNIASCKKQNPLAGFINSIPPFLYAFIYHFQQTDEKKMRELFLISTRNGKHYFAETAMSRYHPHSRTQRKIKHVHGTWQSERYFSDYADTIREELRVVTPISNKNQAVMDEMKACRSVAVHYRRGDYVDSKSLSGNFDICSEKYYKQSMRYIAERVENPVFFIFSDDIPWVQENVAFDYTVRFIDHNNPGHDDLRLMYNCKHAIIANSTFSWWGSYLINNPGKIVTAPSIWQNRNPDIIDIYREDMIKIEI